ncbi:MAG: hypothetical protein GY950_19885, partial [bacterium]|nr:hypothetical protein [bacterium]
MKNAFKKIFFVSVFFIAVFAFAAEEYPELEEHAEMKEISLILYRSAFVLIAVFLFFIIRAIIREKRANRLLAEQKSEIQQQALDLKKLNEKLVELAR